jgi:hypothetical protein
MLHSQIRSPQSSVFLQLPRGAGGRRWQSQASPALSSLGLGAWMRTQLARTGPLGTSPQSYSRLEERDWTHLGHWPSRGRSCPGSSRRNSSARQVMWALRGQSGWGQHRGPSSSCQRWWAGKEDGEKLPFTENSAGASPSSVNLFCIY